MTTDEKLMEISVLLTAMGTKLDYQTKLLEETFLSRDEKMSKAQQHYKRTVESLEKLLTENDSLKGSPFGDMLINSIRSLSDLEE